MRTGDGARSSPGTLLGRERELSHLQATLDAARSGRPGILLVVGEPGIGKTRLVDEGAVLARATGMRVLRGEADRTSQEPMEVWRGVHRALGMQPFRDSSLPAEARRWEHLESLSEALGACAPAVVILEDLHWADPTAVWVLSHLPRAVDGAQIAFVATSRDREPDLPRLDDLRRWSRVIALGGLDVDGVRALAAAETPEPVDAADLHTRTGGNPLFVQELLRSDGSSRVISDLLQGSFDRFDAPTQQVLALASVAGSDAPLEVIAAAAGRSGADLATILRPAVRNGVLSDVAKAGVRFRHALYAEAAGQLADVHPLHARLAAAWLSIGGLDGRASSAGHRLRAATNATDLADAVEVALSVAAELVATGQQTRAAGLLADARQVADAVEQPELRARLALDLADVSSWLGDLDLALSSYQEAAELARSSADAVVRARAEIGANLFASAFVPDLPRMRRLQDALDALPDEHPHLRARLLGRLTVVGRADVGATDRVRAWADEAVAVARSTGDPVLLAEVLLDHSMSPTSPAELDASMVAADEVVRLAEQAGRPDLAVHAYQRRAGYQLNCGDLATATQILGRAEVLASLLPSPAWRHSTLVQRTTLLALSGSRESAVSAMEEAVRVGNGHIEAVVVTGCEAIHRTMLVDLYGQPDSRAEELHRVTSAMIADVPSPVFQVQRGFTAQLFGDDASLQDVLHRFGHEPALLLRSMTGDNLLRVFADTVARAGAAGYAAACYRALLPYAGLLNVGGGHSAGLPTDDVLGRLAVLAGDPGSAVPHLRNAVALARRMPSPPLLVHCLDHLADALRHGGGGDAENPEALHHEAHIIAATHGIRRRQPTASQGTVPDQAVTASMTREGPVWVLRTPLGHARLVDSHGLGYLARLLADRGVEVAALELAGLVSAPSAADLGPALDARAKREYRRRILELQRELEDAETAHDPVRSELAHAEMDALLRELRRAVGLGGRDRPTGSNAERARINVVRSLRRAMTAIAVQAPLLGTHLEESVRTGRYCVYLPEPSVALTWQVDAADRAAS